MAIALPGAAQMHHHEMPCIDAGASGNCVTLVESEENTSNPTFARVFLENTHVFSSQAKPGRYLAEKKQFKVGTLRGQK